MLVLTVLTAITTCRTVANVSFGRSHLADSVSQRSENAFHSCRTDMNVSFGRSHPADSMSRRMRGGAGGTANPAKSVGGWLAVGIRLRN